MCHVSALFIPVVSLIVLLWPVSEQGAPSSSPSEMVMDVKTAAEAVDGASRAGNAAALRTLLHDDLVWLGRRGNVDHKSQVVESAASRKVSMNLEHVRMQVHDGPFAVRTGEWAADPGNPARRVIEVWVQQDRLWQLIARSAVTIEGAPVR